MGSGERSIDVDVPVKMAYNQWTQFEEFPRFMEGVKSVRQLDDATIQWQARIAGVERDWTARIVEQEPDSHIMWEGFGDVDNRGYVSFESLGADECRVTVRIDYEPEGVVEKIADAVGAIEGRIEGDLRRFKEYIESRGTEDGAWRGEIKDGREVG